MYSVSDPESIWSTDWDDGLSQLTAYTAMAKKASIRKDARINNSNLHDFETSEFRPSCSNKLKTLLQIGSRPLLSRYEVFVDKLNG